MTDNVNRDVGSRAGVFGRAAAFGRIAGASNVLGLTVFNPQAQMDLITGQSQLEGLEGQRAAQQQLPETPRGVSAPLHPPVEPTEPGLPRAPGADARRRSFEFDFPITDEQRARYAPDENYGLPWPINTDVRDLTDVHRLILDFPALQDDINNFIEDGFSVRELRDIFNEEELKLLEDHPPSEVAAFLGRNRGTVAISNQLAEIRYMFALNNLYSDRFTRQEIANKIMAATIAELPPDIFLREPKLMQQIFGDREVRRETSLESIRRGGREQFISPELDMEHSRIMFGAQLSGRALTEEERQQLRDIQRLRAEGASEAPVLTTGWNDWLAAASRTTMQSVTAARALVATNEGRSLLAANVAYYAQSRARTGAKTAELFGGRIKGSLAGALLGGFEGAVKAWGQASLLQMGLGYGVAVHSQLLEDGVSPEEAFMPSVIAGGLAGLVQVVPTQRLYRHLIPGANSVQTMIRNEFERNQSMRNAFAHLGRELFIDAHYGSITNALQELIVIRQVRAGREAAGFEVAGWSFDDAKQTVGAYWSMMRIAPVTMMPRSIPSSIATYRNTRARQLNYEATLQTRSEETGRTIAELRQDDINNFEESMARIDQTETDFIRAASARADAVESTAEHVFVPASDFNLYRQENPDAFAGIEFHQVGTGDTAEVAIPKSTWQDAIAENNTLASEFHDNVRYGAAGKTYAEIMSMNENYWAAMNYKLYDNTTDSREAQNIMQKVRTQLLDAGWTAQAAANSAKMAAIYSIIMAERTGVPVSQIWDVEIQSIVGDATISGESFAMYIGRRSQIANKRALESAVSMQQRGEDASTIRRETGWYQGSDGQWRFEIDDSSMRFANEMVNINQIISENNSTHKLGNLIDHPELFNAYPFLRNLQIQFVDIGSGATGAAYGDRLIQLDAKALGNAQAIRETLLHEIQHILQFVEGWSAGGSPESAMAYVQNYMPESRLRSVGLQAYDFYRMLSGEREAFDTGYRMDMDMNARAAEQPALMRAQEQGTSIDMSYTEATRLAQLRTKISSLRNDLNELSANMDNQNADYMRKQISYVANSQVFPDHIKDKAKQAMSAIDAALLEVNEVVRSNNVIRAVVDFIDNVDPKGLFSSELDMTLDARTRQVKMGSIRFERDGRALISLFEAADETTFFHELGHKMLHDFALYGLHESASLQYRQDAQAMFEHLGIDGAEYLTLFNDHLNALEAGETELAREIFSAIRAPQEVFAKMFQDYLITHQAPSSKLKGTFERIRKYLLRYYQDMGMNYAEMTPEIRDIFDRLLATPDQQFEVTTIAEMAINEAMINQRVAEFQEAERQAYREGREAGVIAGIALERERRAELEVRREEVRQRNDQIRSWVEDIQDASRGLVRVTETINGRQQTRKTEGMKVEVQRQIKEALVKYDLKFRSDKTINNRTEIENMFAENPDLDVRGFEIGQESLANMTYNDVMNLHREIMQLAAYGRRQFVEWQAARINEWQEARAKMNADIARLAPQSAEALSVLTSKDLGKNYNGSTATQFLDIAYAALLDPQRMFDHIGGGSIGGIANSFVHYFVDLFNEARSIKLARIDQRIDALANAHADLGNGLTFDTSSLRNEIGRDLTGNVVTKSAAMYMYIALEAADAGFDKMLKAIIYGNFKGRDSTEVLQSIRGIVDSLTEADRRAAYAYVNENAANVSRINTAYARVMNKMFDIAEGPYLAMFRMKHEPKMDVVDNNMMQQIRNGDFESVIRSFDESFGITRQEISEDLQQPILLDIHAAWQRRMDNVEHVIAYGENANTVLNALLQKDASGENLANRIIMQHGQSTYDSVMNYMNLMVTDRVGKSNAVWDQFADYLAGNMPVAYLAWNFGTVALQTVSLPLAFPYASIPHLLSNIKRAFTDAEFRERAYKLDPQLRHRSGDPILSLMRQEDMPDYMRLGLSFIGEMDKRTAVAVQMAVYDTLRPTMNQLEALREAQRITKKTQMASHAMDKPHLWRSSGAGRLMMMFTGDAAKLFNIAIKDLPDAWNDKNFSDLFGILAGYGLSAIMVGMLRNPPEEFDPESLIKWAGAQPMHQLLRSVPILGTELNHTFRRMLGGRGGFRDDNRATTFMLRFRDGVYRIMNGETPDDYARGMLDMLEGFALIDRRKRIPSNAIRRMYQVGGLIHEGRIPAAIGRGVLGTPMPQQQSTGRF